MTKLDYNHWQMISAPIATGRYDLVSEAKIKSHLMGDLTGKSSGPVKYSCSPICFGEARLLHHTLLQNRAEDFRSGGSRV